MNFSTKKTVALIVTHPDDETLWAGGTIISNPSWKCYIVCLCRGRDMDCAPRFYEALKELQVEGIMGNLDDRPDQNPPDEDQLKAIIMKLLPSTPFDMIITYNSKGELKKQLWYEKTKKAVFSLWNSGELNTKELWTFAYEDGEKKYTPSTIKSPCILKHFWK